MKQSNTPKNFLGNKNLLTNRIGQRIVTGVLILAGLLGLTQLQDDTSDRVTEGLVVLYDFQEGRGDVVRDMSGVGTAMNLTIADEDHISWLADGGVSINTGTIIQSSGAASKIINAIQTSRAITIEAWVRPQNNSQDGPARIVSLSENAYKRNFTLGQEDHQYVLRFQR